MSEVYLSGSCGTRSVYHSKRDCPALDRANVVRPESKKHFQHLSECKICQNGGKLTGNNHEYEEKECSLCGETFKNLAAHIRSCAKTGGASD